MIFSPYANIRLFEGVVESRQDPLEVGRVQVRVFGIHSDNLTNIPTSDLHWMQVAHPTTSPATSGISSTPALVEGSHVIGYFRDGELCQDGIVTNVICGIPQRPRNPNQGFNDVRKDLSKSPKQVKDATPSKSGVVISDEATPYPRYVDESDLSRATRNLDTVVHKLKKKNRITGIKIASGSSFSEPEYKNNSVYPYNIVTEYESGHLFEIDNTPNNERVSLNHRLGSYIDMLNNGTVVYKSTHDRYNITNSDENNYIGGTQNTTIKKGCNLLVNVEGGDNNLLITVSSGGDMSISIQGGNLNINVDGDITQKCSGDYKINVDGDYVLKAKTIKLN